MHGNRFGLSSVSEQLSRTPKGNKVELSFLIRYITDVSVACKHYLIDALSTNITFLTDLVLGFVF